jgi:hypothetical protein
MSGYVDDFERYLNDLAQELGHSDRIAGLKGYCTGLVLPLSRKSVEPMAAHIDPMRASARHQALHHFVAKADWSDAALLRRVRSGHDARVGHLTDTAAVAPLRYFSPIATHRRDGATPFSSLRHLANADTLNTPYVAPLTVSALNLRRCQGGRFESGHASSCLGPHFSLG